MLSKAPMADHLPTPRMYLGLHSVHVYCATCAVPKELDLQAMIDRGYGDTPLIQLPLTCSSCGNHRYSISVSSRPSDCVQPPLPAAAGRG